MHFIKTRTRAGESLLLLVFTALFAALVTVTTMFIKIPTLFGYVHAGDSMIYLGASVLPGPFGVIASAVGGGLSDLFSGYPHWVLPTAIIKALNALPFAIVRYYTLKQGKELRIISLPNLLMLIPTSLVTVFGYFTAHLIMYDFSAAVAGLATEWIQPLAGAIIFIVVGKSLDALKINKLL